MTSSVTSTSTSSLAMPGLVSGMDTASIIKKVEQYRQAQIDNLTSKKADLQFEKTTLQSFNTQVLALQNAMFDLKLDTAFKTKNITSSNTQVVTATVLTSAATGQHTVKVSQLAQAAQISSNVYTPRIAASNTAGLTGLKGALTATPRYLLSGICEGTTDGTIGTSISSGNNSLAVTVDGIKVNVTLANATANTTSISTVASDLQTKINDALNQAHGTSNVTYVRTNTTSTAGGSNDKIYLLSNFDGSQNDVSVDSSSSAATALGFNNLSNMNTVAGTDASGGDHNLTFTGATAFSLTGASSAGPFTIDTTNNKLNLTVNGVTNEITLTSQSGVTGATMASSLQSDINSTFGSGAVSVTYNGSAFVMTDGLAGVSNNIVLAAASGNDARNTLGLATVTNTIGTNARVVDVFSPTTGASSTKTVEDTTNAGTASDMAGLLKALNGVTLDSGHTNDGGGPLMNGVTFSTTSGLTAGTALVRTGWGNELNTSAATNATYIGASNIASSTITLTNTLNNDNLNTAPSTATNGTFTINGKTITISDYTKESMNDVIAKINASGAGVTCSYDSTNNRLVLTSNTSGGGQTITVGSSSDTSNFLYVSGFYGSGAGFTDGDSNSTVDPTQTLVSGNFSTTPTSGIVTINDVAIYINASTDTLNDVISKINSSAAGVTASFNATNDTFSLVSKSDDSGHDVITLGSANDTSNFFWATKLVYPPNLDSDGDDILTTKTQVGQPGQRALFQVDGSNYTRKGNTVSDIITGVTLNLQSSQSATDAPVTISITANTDQALTKVANFITLYNKTVAMASPDQLTSDEKKNELPALTTDQQSSMTTDEIQTYDTNRDSLRAREILRNDISVYSFYNDMRQIASNQVEGVDSSYNSLAQVGINTGEIGTSWGNNNHGMLLTTSTDQSTILQALKDNTTFMNDLQNNPDEMAKLFGQLTDSTITKSGTADVSSVVLSSQNTVRVGDGTNSALITLAAGTYTGSDLANAINQQLKTANITDITFLLNSSNKIEAKTEVDASTYPHGQAVLDLEDVNGDLFHNLMGLEPGCFYGPTVDSLTGLARRFENLSRDYTQVGGVLQDKIKDNGELDQQISDVGDQIDSMEDRMAMEEQGLQTQFNNLESYLSTANTQSSWITQNMAAESSSTSSS